MSDWFQYEPVNITFNLCRKPCSFIRNRFRYKKVIEIMGWGKVAASKAGAVFS